MKNNDFFAGHEHNQLINKNIYDGSFVGINKGANINNSPNEGESLMDSNTENYLLNQYMQNENNSTPYLWDRINSQIEMEAKRRKKKNVVGIVSSFVTAAVVLGICVLVSPNIFKVTKSADLEEKNTDLVEESSPSADDNSESAKDGINYEDVANGIFKEITGETDGNVSNSIDIIEDTTFAWESDSYDQEEVNLIVEGILTEIGQKYYIIGYDVVLNTDELDVTLDIRVDLPSDLSDDIADGIGGRFYLECIGEVEGNYLEGTLTKID